MNNATRQVAEHARQAYLALLGCSEADKNHALAAMAKSLKTREADILEANRQDLEAADAMVASGTLSPPLRARLVFGRSKLSGVLTGIDQVIALPDPSGRILWGMELDKGLILERKSCPLGVIGVIFESRPDVVVQISSLILKAGNAGILKGGHEAKKTNVALMDAIRAGLQDAGTVPQNALQLVSGREEVQALLDCDDQIDLLIPRGSNDLVRFIRENTRIPVLGHTDGICHVYLHESADLEKALRVCIDSKTEYPAVCNAAETVLVDANAVARLLPPLVEALRGKGVEIRTSASARGLPGLENAPEADWRAEYLDLKINLKIVEGLAEAEGHINRYGSHHTDAIVAEDRAAADHFCRYVDSANVFVNASTRFADGFRYGLGAEIGISTNKIHARGPVGLEGIVTYKYELQGNGHVAAEYNSGARSYTHNKR